MLGFIKVPDYLISWICDSYAHTARDLSSPIGSLLIPLSQFLAECFSTILSYLKTGFEQGSSLITCYCLNLLLSVLVSDTFMAESIGIALIRLKCDIATFDASLQKPETNETDATIRLSDMLRPTQLITGAITDEGMTVLCLFELSECLFKVSRIEQWIIVNDLLGCYQYLIVLLYRI
jgi:hypothetical protein